DLTVTGVQTCALPICVNGFDIETVYTPAAEVAGDFYDFIELDADHFGVLIADVSGHGVPAALVASMLKIALATQAPFAASPAQLDRKSTRLNSSHSQI